LAVQSLAADTKLHALFDETHHEGENIMDYQPPHLDSAMEVDAVLSDMSVLEEEDVNESYSDLGEASCSCDTQTKGIEGDDDNDPIRDDKNLDWVDDNDPEYDVKYIEKDDDDKVNMEAYDTEDVSGSGLQKSEQAGVVHLVHGPSKDTLMMYVLRVLLVSFAHRFRGYIFRETLL